MCEANMMNTIASHGSDQFKRGASISGLDTDVISALPLRSLCANAPTHGQGQAKSIVMIDLTN